MLYLKYNCVLPQSSQIRLPFVNGYILIAQSAKERGARQRGRPTTQQNNLLARILQLLLIRRTNLAHTHLLEHIRSVLLEATDVDGSLLGRLQIAAAHAKIACRAHHATGQSQRIVGKDGLGRAVVVLVCDRSDETLYVQLGRT